MKHLTLLLAWLKHEAYITLKEQELSLLHTPAAPASKGANSRNGGGKTHPKGGKNGTKGGNSGGKGGRGARIGTPPVRAVPETPLGRLRLLQAPLLGPTPMLFAPMLVPSAPNGLVSNAPRAVAPVVELDEEAEMIVVPAQAVATSRLIMRSHAGLIVRH